MQDLIGFPLWCLGPSWLLDLKERWPKSAPNQIDSGVLKIKSHNVVVNGGYYGFVRLESSSNWLRTVHIVSYVFKAFRSPC